MRGAVGARRVFVRDSTELAEVRLRTIFADFEEGQGQMEELEAAAVRHGREFALFAQTALLGGAWDRRRWCWGMAASVPLRKYKNVA